MKKGFANLLILIAVFALAIIFIGVLTIKSFAVTGDSMKPTLIDGQKIVVNKFAYINNSPKRGDIIVVGVEGESNIKSLVRRVVGLPGETIEVKKGRVLINNDVLNETYLTNIGESDFDQESINLSAERYYVLADNRNTDYYRGKDITVGIVAPQNFFKILGKYWFSY